MADGVKLPHEAPTMTLTTFFILQLSRIQSPPLPLHATGPKCPDLGVLESGRKPT